MAINNKETFPMKIFFALIAPILVTSLSFASSGVYSSRSYNPLEDPLVLSAQVQALVAGDACLQAALVAVTAELQRHPRETGILFHAVDYNNSSKDAGYIALHFQAPVAFGTRVLSRHADECQVGEAILSPIGGGGVSVHN
jgi:hypothetical protein